MSLTRVRMSLGICLLALLAFGAGCTGVIGDPPENTERATPLGCDKRRARYFDPKTGTCVTPASEQQAYILDQYHYLAEYAQNDEPTLTRELQISFAKELSPDELFKLMESLPEAKVSYVGMDFSAYNYPRAINPRFASPVSISEVPMAAVKDIEAMYDKPDPVLEEQANKKNYTVWQIKVVDTAEHLLTWWTDRQSDITVVEPQVNVLDKVKPGIPPWHVEHLSL